MSNKPITFAETMEWFQSTDYAGPLGLTVKFPVPPDNHAKFQAFLEEYAPYVLTHLGFLLGLGRHYGYWR